MTSPDRRRFLKLAAASATAAAGGLPPAIRQALAIPAHRRTGTIQDVEHVVILMQENRSFDHYFGCLRGVRGFGDPRPIALPDGKPVWYQPTGDFGGGYLLPFHPTASNLGLQFIEDLPHGWNDTHAAINGGRNNNWIPAKSISFFGVPIVKGTTTMAYLDRADIPFHYALADAFTVCDGYHCSIPASTDPNRYYMWTGYVGNDGAGGGPVLDNAESGYSWTTYPERLEQAGVSWKIYQDIGHGLDANGHWGWTQDDPYIGTYGDNSLLYFNQYRHAQPGSPLYDKARTGTCIAANSDDPTGLFTILRQDVLNGTLPQVSWIVAPEAYTEHPSWPANYGAWYVNQVLEALTANPEVWSKTALLLTYDENDGFFDHVTPPSAPGSREQGLSTVSTDQEWYGLGKGFASGCYGLGPRVPMLVISPWSKGGWVCSQTFDHTSIIRFLETRFGVHEPNISAWRRAVCGDLTSAFDFSCSSVDIPSLPDTRAWIPDGQSHSSYHPQPPADQRLPVQEPGVRPARPLSYDFDVRGRVDLANGRYWLDFENDGELGVSLLVLAENRSDGPWNYTVEANREISDYWTSGHSLGAYALSVYGPNGFLRVFKGRQQAEVGAQALPEARVASHGRERHEHDHGNHYGYRRGRGRDRDLRDRARDRIDELWLTLSNAGNQICTFTVKANDYLDEPARRYAVPPGASVDDVWNIARSGHWYDLIVTVDSDDTFQRRFAGHIETGEPSISDPAFERSEHRSNIGRPGDIPA